MKRIFVVAYMLFADNDSANRNHVFGSLYPMFIAVCTKKNKIKNQISDMCTVYFHKGHKSSG